MTQSPLSGVEDAQRLWARNAGLQVDDRGYLPEVDQNLFGGLTPPVRAAFGAADGNELEDAPDRPAKMRALISSSALAVNAFQNWSLRDPAPLGPALGIAGSVTRVEFERRLPTGAPGTPPNLDVVLTLGDGGIVGFESKFTEWIRPGTKQAASLGPYFRTSPSLWEGAGLHDCARLARAVHDGKERFDYLNVSQLLKHALGLNRAATASWSLGYVWFDADGEAGTSHRAEIARFVERVGEELRFLTVSYQQFVEALGKTATNSHGYFAYLHQRYGLGPGQL